MRTNVKTVNAEINGHLRTVHSRDIHTEDYHTFYKVIEYFENKGYKFETNFHSNFFAASYNDYENSIYITVFSKWEA